MRVAIFHNLPVGGAKRVLDEHVGYLSKDHEVKVYTYDLKKKKNRIVNDLKQFLLLPFLHKKIAVEIDRENFDVVLVHPDKLTQAPYLLRFLKTPSIYFCEELLRIGYEKELAFDEKAGIIKRFYEHLNRMIRKKIDIVNAQSAIRIAAASKYINEKVKKAYARKAFVCPLGIDYKVFRKAKVKKENQLLFVGEPNRINGFGFAKRIAKKTNLKLKVIFGWKLNDSELSFEYSKSLAVLAVSYNEPFGLVPVEAQSCESIILAVNKGGYKETIIDKKTGFLLPRDIGAFTDKIEKIKKDKALTNRIGKNARKHVIDNFSWERHIVCLTKNLKSL